MLVIDTSALVAIINNEPERREFLSIIASSTDIMMSAITWYETMIVARHYRGQRGVDIVTRILVERNVTIMPFDLGAAAEAVSAHQRYGGRKHPAQLTFGDCAAYALARTFECPLLFKGNDFAQTDASPAHAPPSATTR